MSEGGFRIVAVGRGMEKEEKGGGGSLPSQRKCGSE